MEGQANELLHSIKVRLCYKSLYFYVCGREDDGGGVLRFMLISDTCAKNSSQV